MSHLKTKIKTQLKRAEYRATELAKKRRKSKQLRHKIVEAAHVEKEGITYGAGSFREVTYDVILSLASRCHPYCVLFTGIVGCPQWHQNMEDKPNQILNSDPPFVHLRNFWSDWPIIVGIS